jgi:hypothetical protein
MAQLREMVASPQYTALLDRFSNLIHRPTHVMEGIQADAAARGAEGQESGDWPEFQEYTSQVNRQISDIGSVLTSMSTQLTGNRPATGSNPVAQPQAQASRPSAQNPPSSTQTRTSSRSQPSAQPDEPALPRVTLGDRSQRVNPATGELETIQGGQYHPVTSGSERVAYRVKMRALTVDDTTLSVEQKDCISCACHNCWKMFSASTRYLQGRVERGQAFERMTSEDLEIQERILRKQFSMVVELYGADFIRARPSRGRHFEGRFGRSSPNYS